MPAPEQDMSVMGLYNSSSFSSLLGREMLSFRKLYRAKAMLHHYTEYTDVISYLNIYILSFIII